MWTKNHRNSTSVTLGFIKRDRWKCRLADQHICLLCAKIKRFTQVNYRWSSFADFFPPMGTVSPLRLLARTKPSLASEQVTKCERKLPSLNYGFTSIGKLRWNPVNAAIYRVGKTATKTVEQCSDEQIVSVSRFSPGILFLSHPVSTVSLINGSLMK